MRISHSPPAREGVRFGRSTLVGALLGFGLAMPLFEVCLLTILLVDGTLLDARVAMRYFSRPLNLIALLGALHVAGGVVGAAVGYARWRVRRPPRLRVIPGGLRGRR